MRSLKSLNYFPLCFDGKAYACFRFFVVPLQPNSKLLKNEKGIRVGIAPIVEHRSRSEEESKSATSVA